GLATDMGLRRDSSWHRTHPVTGARIEGRTLPYWSEVVDLACRAQTAFSDRPFVGWDIAILDSGPCLIEGNGGPDMDIIQRVYREPLGSSPFGRILAEHVCRKFGFDMTSAELK
ncbi:MAG: sugar-transfer associated ATP-grasp domain-containing protein, partial [Dongiaceae bacterium]